MILKKSKFTFTELLVMIALLSAILALLQPALHRTVWSAKHTMCMNNLKQSYQTFSLYYEDNNILNPWAVANGTIDGPHESYRNTRNGNPGNPAKVLVNDDYLLNPENLFCPLSSLNAKDHYHRNARQHNKISGKANFWSSYSYLYKSNRNSILMGDTIDTLYTVFEKVYKVEYEVPFRFHYNILNVDGTVVYLTDIEEEYINYYLNP